MASARAGLLDWLGTARQESVSLLFSLRLFIYCYDCQNTCMYVSVRVRLFHRNNVSKNCLFTLLHLCKCGYNLQNPRYLSQQRVKILSFVRYTT